MDGRGSTTEGRPEPVERLAPVPSNLRPEAIVATPRGVFLISDDGSVDRGGRDCEDRLEAGEDGGYARAAHIDLPPHNGAAVR